jgi:outer membrane protein assembly factor BamE (lipoprotein component of BamABCDE complex)
MHRSRIVVAPALTALLLASLLGTFLGTAACKHPTPVGPEASNITVGKVQGEIKVGMSAASVAEILGSPNIVTTDEQRREVWIYDKVSTESVDTSNSFGGTIIILGGQTSQRERSRTQKTLTIIIKYDENKLVRDFAYNASQF